MAALPGRGFDSRQLHPNSTLLQCGVFFTPTEAQVLFQHGVPLNLNEQFGAANIRNQE